MIKHAVIYPTGIIGNVVHDTVEECKEYSDMLTKHNIFNKMIRVSVVQLSESPAETQGVTNEVSNSVRLLRPHLSIVNNT